MEKEMSAHDNGKHWEIIRKSKVKGSIIKVVWSFKRKRDPSCLITKHKARTCAHSEKQRWGEGYRETYVPVINWFSV